MHRQRQVDRCDTRSWLLAFMNTPAFYAQLTVEELLLLPRQTASKPSHPDAAAGLPRPQQNL